jgi:hypothetical protein
MPTFEEFDDASLSQMIDNLKDANFDESKYTIDDIKRISERFNPYNKTGIVFNSEQKSYAVSVTNWRDRWLRKFYLTALSGFIFRTAENYLADPKLPNRDLQRQHIIGFLQNQFEYDPDRHVRKAKDEITDENGLTDKERFEKEELIRKLTANESAKAIEDEIRADPETFYNKSIDNMKTLFNFARNVHNNLIDISEGINRVIEMRNGGEADADELRKVADSYICKSTSTLRDMLDRIKPLVEGSSMNDTKPSVEHDLPIEVFRNFDRYINNNYDNLRMVTTSLYNEKPDIEFAIQIYKDAKDESEIDKFVETYDSMIATDVFKVKSNEWALLGPFRRNQARMKYFGKESHLINRMFEKHVSEKALVKDIMKKRVEREYKKNLEEAGPQDVKKLEEYQKVMSTIQQYGGQTVLSPEEKMKLNEAVRQKKVLEASDDVVMVDVHKSNPAEGTFTTETIYTLTDEAAEKKGLGSAPVFTNDTGKKSDNSIDATDYN